MDRTEAKKFIRDIAASRKALTEPEAKEVLRAFSVPVPSFAITRDIDEAKKTADDIGYPVALKIVSPDILHKSDVGGVSLGIRDGKELEEKWNEMIFSIADERATARIEGFLIEAMAPKGVEVIVGATRDEQFGPLIMFGTGGIAVELMKDVSFRLAPVARDEAFAMMKEVRGYPLLTGYRGGHPKDLDAIAEIIIKVSEAMMELDEIKELEINPLIVFEEGSLAVDGKALLY